jgi:hypothetical protein
MDWKSIDRDPQPCQIVELSARGHRSRVVAFGVGAILGGVPNRLAARPKLERFFSFIVTFAEQRRSR